MWGEGRTLENRMGKGGRAPEDATGRMGRGAHRSTQTRGRRGGTSAHGSCPGAVAHTRRTAVGRDDWRTRRPPDDAGGEPRGHRGRSRPGCGGLRRGPGVHPVGALRGQSGARGRRRGKRGPRGRGAQGREGPREEVWERRGPGGTGRSGQGRGRGRVPAQGWCG